ncbi:hemerythrin domain-containing protein [Streptomyces sp. NPDC058401]|uniref:hemerythrin domain-containing protein n=1 Tax=Streptomyces sp. NPDC058401 TaxID=3346480 RepID=UPI00364B64ED
MSTAVDLTFMHATHAALRRDLVQLDRISISADHDLRQVLASIAGWPRFKKALRLHHAAADDALWPALRWNLSGRPDDLVRLEVMEAEHAAFPPVLDAIDTSLADPEGDRAHLGSLIDVLCTGLDAHLTHEETMVLPLLREVLAPDQWAHFDAVRTEHLRADAPVLLPWLLDGADGETAVKLLAPLPAAVRAAYAAQWLPAHRAADPWSPAGA